MSRFIRVFSLCIVTLMIAGGFLFSSDDGLQVMTPVVKDKSQLYVPGEVIVRFRLDIQIADIDSVLSRVDGKVKYTSKSGDYHVIGLPNGMTVEEGIRYFSAQDGVRLAEPNYLRYLHFRPNDPYYSYQWHFSQISMESAWDLSTSDPSVVVAIVDTGVAYENYGAFLKAPDLVGTSFVPGYDFVNNDAHPNDEGGNGFGHGTFVAGVIAQSTNNGLGVAGMAFSASIMPIRVCSDQGLCPVAYVADGIRWAVDHGADVINISLGGSTGSEVEQDAILYAYNNGAVLVASSGNSADEADFSGDVDYPARYPQVLAVGATRYDETRSYYSSYGPKLDVVAPGGDVTVDQNGDGYNDGILQNTFNGDITKFGYWFAQGTSFSAPHASALAALLVSKGLRDVPSVVYDVIRFSARDVGAVGRDNTYGYGIIDPVHALLGLGLFE
jgi:serine protease